MFLNQFINLAIIFQTVMRYLFMRIIYLLCVFITATITIFSQSVDINICETYKRALRAKSTIPFDSLLQNKDFNISDFDRSDLYSFRAKARLALNQKNIKNDSIQRQLLLDEMYQDLSQAIDLIDDKSEQLKHTWRRYVFLNRLSYPYKDMNTDLALLKDNGYKEKKMGIALYPKVMFDGDFWLGAELSLLSAFFPQYTLISKDKVTIYKDKYSTSFALFTLGYAQNLQRTEWSDFNISILRIEAPFYIDILQFGFINGPAGNSWYYRPELGLGYSIFQLSVGYNIFFQNEESSEISNLLTNFRVKYNF